MHRSFPLLLWMFGFTRAQFITTDIPIIKAVSAMCSSEGITASIDFDRPFNGKIYSMDYATVHDCVYYNMLDMATVLFSIPAHRCGTKLSRTTRNIVDQMLNRVYVQMDRDMQTAADKQFSFICQLAEGRNNRSSDNSIRRHPTGVLRDAYPTPSLAASMNSYPQVDPIKPSEVRVAAFSSDNKLGNWPIPGARPFDPAMKATPVFPQQPLPAPIQPNSVHRSPIQQATESIYVSHLPTARPVESQKTAHSKDPTKDSYASPPQLPAIVPQRSPPMPQAAMNSFFANTYPRAPIQRTNMPTNAYSMPIQTSFQPTVNSYPRQPVMPLRSPPLPHRVPPAYQHLGLRNEYARPPISPSEVHIQQGIGMGLQAKNATEATKIPALTWNMAVGEAESQTTTPLSSTKPPRKFIEEPKRIGVEFTSDADTNTIDSRDQTSPREQLVSTQEHFAARPEVVLEIQMGDGPGAPAVSRPVRIGDNITLVVKSTSQMKGEKDFDMFVHSCFATDGEGSTKIDLIDSKGCVVRREFVSPLSRRRESNGQMTYFFRIAAFKFPGPDDVYFSCSIDLTPFRTAPEICSSSSSRWKRDSSTREMRLFDIVRVELSGEYERQLRLDADDQLYCATPALFGAITVLVCTLLISFAISSLSALSFYFKLSSLRAKY